jgi:hypothetical protein
LCGALRAMRGRAGGGGRRLTGVAVGRGGGGVGRGRGVTTGAGLEGVTGAGAVCAVTVTVSTFAGASPETLPTIAISVTKKSTSKACKTSDASDDSANRRRNPRSSWLWGVRAMCRGVRAM